MVHEERALQVVDLVLQRDGEEVALGDDLEGLAVVVEGADPDLVRALHLLGLAGDREAPLGVDRLPLAARRSPGSRGG